MTIRTLSNCAKLSLALGMLTAWPCQAASVPVPNHSFEAPSVPEVAPFLDVWQKTPKPDWFVETPPDQLWANFIGVFKNTPSASTNHIPNMDSAQALYLFNMPQVGLFQELEATFEPGKAYTLTVGAIGGGGRMPEGASLLLNLYYTDAASNMVTVAALPVTHSTNLFPSLTSLVDISLQSPAIKASDAAAGKKIGIMIVSTSGQELIGGYWDLDNVRLTKTESIAVPNHSFEAPSVPEVAPFLDVWQKTPKPDWFVETPPDQLWANFIGVFKNTPSASTNHIPNMDAAQALYLFNMPQAGLFQELEAAFEPGKSYTLTVGAIGGGGRMPEGASLLLNLYYTDSASNMVTVAALPVTHSTNLFPSLVSLVDISLQSPVIKASDAAAGKKIGIMIVSTSGQELIGGYWDLDNVRLTGEASSTGLTLAFVREGSNIRVTWPTTTGKNYQLQVSQSLPTWSNHHTAMAGTGAIASATLAVAEFPHAFFRVVEVE